MDTCFRVMYFSRGSFANSSPVCTEPLVDFKTTQGSAPAFLESRDSRAMSVALMINIMTRHAPTADPPSTCLLDMAAPAAAGGSHLDIAQRLHAAHAIPPRALVTAHVAYHHSRLLRRARSMKVMMSHGGKAAKTVPVVSRQELSAVGFGECTRVKKKVTSGCLDLT